MSQISDPAEHIEAWMRGALPGVPALLQPAAHALTACREEVDARVMSVSIQELWAEPGGAPSAGFHLHHAAGSLDRLFTYARGEPLSTAQLESMNGESTAKNSAWSAERLVEQFDRQVDLALEQIRGTDEATLTQVRGVGRAQRPSTVIGLLFHGAEHTQRHIGQMRTTLRVVRGLNGTSI